MRVQKQVLHVIGFDQTKVNTEEVCEEERQVVDELLFVIRGAVVCRFDVYAFTLYTISLQS